MDELLLQLAETLRKTMALCRPRSGPAATVSTSSPSRFRTGGAAHHPRGRRAQRGRPRPVSGNSWLAVWVPAMLAGGRRSKRVLRLRGSSASRRVHRRRAPSLTTPIDEHEDPVLGDLAGNLALAGHNVRLDSALETSLVELQLRNANLVVGTTRANRGRG